MNGRTYTCTLSCYHRSR